MRSQSAMRLPTALRFLTWAVLVTRIASQDAPADDAAAADAGADAGDTGGVKANFAAAAFRVTTQCMVSLQNMLFNDDFMFMNDTFTRWCRIRTENKMSTCCENAEFAKGKADSCSDCVADCIFTRMIDLCNGYFGKACTIQRKPFSANNVTFSVRETFCVPSDCDNAEDLTNNLLIKWYDAQYKYERTSIWMVDYSDSLDIECPTATVTIIIAVVVTVILGIASVPLAILLFKAPKERGRVLRGVEEDDENEGDTPVEALGGAPDADALAVF